MASVETIFKSKPMGYFLIFWGLTFLLRGIVDIEYYAVNIGKPDFTETTFEVGTWILSDAFAIAAAIALFLVAVKILQAKKTPPAA